MTVLELFTDPPAGFPIPGVGHISRKVNVFGHEVFRLWPYDSDGEHSIRVRPELLPALGECRTLVEAYALIDGAE
jgi:hypothetical protein